MPAVLILTDIVKCLHSPGAATNAPATKLTVGNPPAAVLTDLQPVVGCSHIPPPVANVPCTTVTITVGKATKLNVGGAPVLLGSLVATAAGSPGGPLSVTPCQAKLLAI